MSKYSVGDICFYMGKTGMFRGDYPFKAVRIDCIYPIRGMYIIDGHIYQEDELIPIFDLEDEEAVEMHCMLYPQYAQEIRKKHKE